jgi:hypothetical protein
VEDGICNGGTGGYLRDDGVRSGANVCGAALYYYTPI